MRVAGRRRGALERGGRVRARRGRARPRAAPARRRGGLPAAARGRRRADPDAHRPRRARRRASRASTPAPTTTSSSRSSAPSCSPACARCCAAARRAAAPTSWSATCASTPTPARCLAATATLELTAREFELLEHLMRNERLVVSRQALLDEVWGYHPFAETNTVDVFISNLRRKLEAGGEARVLHTVRGAGYVLREPEDAPPGPLQARPCVDRRAHVRDPLPVRRRDRRVRRAAHPGGLRRRPARHRRRPPGRLRADARRGRRRPGACRGPARSGAAAGGAAVRVVRPTARSCIPPAGQRRPGPTPPRALHDVGPATASSRARSCRRADRRPRRLRPARASPVGEAVAYVQYAKPKAASTARSTASGCSSRFGVIGGTLLAFLAGLYVARRAMRPIAGLTRAAREVARTRDPDVTLPKPEANDEVVGPRPHARGHARAS